ncbi:MAG: FtsX-like permease family protein [Chloroflexota bacterium]|nr:FtsX-like permease family protein [Chloroflexota bacterium]
MGKLLRLAWRNVWRNGRRTVIAGTAIALGLTFLLVYDGLLGGFKEAIYGNVVRLQGGNVQVHAPGYREKAGRMPLYPLPGAETIVQVALAQPNVVAAQRRIQTNGMISSHEATMPVVITGIEPERVGSVSMIAQNMLQGRFLAPGDEDLLVIGQGLADKLEVGMNDRVTLVGRATHERTRHRTMTIVGIYDLGAPQVEERMVYVSLLEAQILFDLHEQATEVTVYLERVGQEPPVVDALQASLPGYEVDSWYTLDPSTKEMMELETLIMNLFGIVILLIAGVGIFNLMLMAVFERTREIGILAAMGMKWYETVMLFLFEGVLIGLLGALAGTVLGGAINAYFGRVGIDLTALYGGIDVGEFGEVFGLMGDRLYFRIGIDVLLARALTVAVIAALASLYPAWQAAKREPAEALHYV